MEATPSSTDSSTSNSRCNYLQQSGRRCRLPISDPGSDFCRKHLRLREEILASSDLTLNLTGPFQRFDSARKINDFLSDLLRLLAQKRISARDASVMAFISGLQLRTLPVIDKELAAEAGPPRIIFGRARPEHDATAPDPPTTRKTPAEAMDAYRKLRT